MHIEIKRFISDDDSTLSIWRVNDKYECFAVEDEFRETKVPRETRIPCGFYHVGVRTYGSFHDRYSKKFSDFHMGMLEILDVKGFTDVLIHIGNSDEDSAGCLCVGSYPVIGDELRVANSAAAYKKLYQKVIQDAKQGMLTLSIIDEDRRL